MCRELAFAGLNLNSIKLYRKNNDYNLFEFSSDIII